MPAINPNELKGLHFQGAFRSYQERILGQCEKSLRDNKLHIVAAPGSGKTILGLEILCRLNHPALILAPSITVREQWKERFLEWFVQEENKAEWEKCWSESLEDVRTITCVTYQALYQYFRNQEAELLAKRLEEQGVETICLDEAHHLQREWWKALEQLTLLLQNARLVALTATPPYDAGNQEWRRYSELCGEIDEEIFTPELVQEGSLCPHQDFVYLCVPDKQEKKKLEALKAEPEQTLEEILMNPALQAEIEAHPGVADPFSYAEIFLEEPGYLTALLCYLKQKGIKAPKLKRLIGTKAILPPLNEYWLSQLLYGILWKDKNVYSEKLRGELSELLTKRHLLRGNRLYFDKQEERDKILKSSVSKLRAMEAIVKEERESQKEQLRLLILTDHIRKEQLNLVGNCEKTIDEIGAVPVFELIRRMLENEPEGKAAMLTGSYVILPAEAAAVCDLHGKTLIDGYEWILVNDGERKRITAAVTALFGEGYFSILVGTAALLGEGWDAPFVNSLIIASTAAAYVQSNQMRGRALRVDKNQPEKVANIWHLAALEPGSGDDQPEYEAVSRRFQTFLGVETAGTGICNGIERLSLLQKPFTGSRIEKMNADMLYAARDRKQTREQWKQAEYENESFSRIREETDIPRKAVRKNFRYYNALAAMILGSLGFFVTLSERFVLPVLRHTSGETMPVKLYQIVVLVLSVIVGNYGYRLVRKLTPQGRISEVAMGLWDTLIERGVLTRETQVNVFEKSEYAVEVALENASVRESNVYAGCIREIYGVIENPRYLLKEKIIPGRYEYYNVPEVFGRNKKDAESFCRNLRRHHQKFQLVYTRTFEGRRELLKARARGYGNYCRQDVLRRKRVKTKWE